MTQAWIATGILVVTMAAFAWGRLRPEVVALGAVLAVGLSGIMPPAEAFAGFGDPTVVTIASLFVVSAGLERTGVAVTAARWLLRAVGAREAALVAAVMLLAGALSGVMNLIGAMAMLLPVTLAVCRETGISPGRLLMPLAIASRLGGALTLVGKASNLIVSGLLVQAGYAPLGFFAFFPVGLALLAVGTAFMVTAGRRLLPDRAPERPGAGATGPGLREIYRLPERLFRIRVEEGSALTGQTIAQASLGEAFGINVLGIVRGRTRTMAPPPDERIHPGDVLIVGAHPEEMERLGRLGTVEVEADRGEDPQGLETDAIGLVEMVLAPRSDLAGKSLRELEFRQRFGLTVVAIWRAGRPRRTRLADLPLEYGDALLLHGPRERIRLLRQDPNLIALDEPLAPRRSRAPVALAAAGLLIVLGTTGAVPLSLAAMLAAGVVVIGGCVTAEESFGSVDWPTVVVTAGLLPLGVALQTTGAASALAGAVLTMAGGAPVGALAALVLAAFVIGHVVPSIPSTILMAPIALSTARALGANPVPFMIAVASVTSVTLVTPISHPVNLMVMGPGGYRFGDYVRVGAPAALLLTAALLAVVVLVWPL